MIIYSSVEEKTCWYRKPVKCVCGVCVLCAAVPEWALSPYTDKSGHEQPGVIPSYLCWWAKTTHRRISPSPRLKSGGRGAGGPHCWSPSRQIHLHFKWSPIYCTYKATTGQGLSLFTEHRACSEEPAPSPDPHYMAWYQQQVPGPGLLEYRLYKKGLFVGNPTLRWHHCLALGHSVTRYDSDSFPLPAQYKCVKNGLSLYDLQAPSVWLLGNGSPAAGVMSSH